MAQIFSKNSSFRKNKAAIFAVSSVTMATVIVGVTLSFAHQPAYSLSFGHHESSQFDDDHDHDDHDDHGQRGYRGGRGYCR